MSGIAGVGGGAGDMAPLPGSRGWRLVRGAWVGAVSVALSWMMVLGWNGGFMTFLVLLWGWLIWKRRWWALAAVFVVSPWTVALVGKCVAYAQGSPTFVRGKDQIWHPQGSSDPVTRVRGRNPGCGITSGIGRVNQWAESVAPRVMHPLMGPPPGAYLGPYPTEAEAMAALENAGEAVWPTYPVQGSRWVRVEGVEVKVPADWLEPSGYMGDLGRAVRRGMIWKGRCAVVGVRMGMEWYVYLVDVEKGEMVGMYMAPAR